MLDGLRNSGLPLGGLGTGSVELRRDGYFHEWQIMNNRPWGSGPEVDLPLETSHFGLQVHGENTNRSALLGLAGGFNGYLNNPYDLAWLEHPEEINADIRMPFTVLKYNLGSFPIAATLEAFSPFIPLDAKNSALPLAFFTFNLRNCASKPLKVSLFNATQNFVGYAQPGKRSRMTFHKAEHSSRILFERERLDEDNPSRGTMVIGALGCGEIEPTYVLHPVTYRDIWDPLRESGVLEDCDNGDNERDLELPAGGGDAPRGLLPFGVLCQSTRLEPGESRDIVFVLAWHFPVMRERDYGPKNSEGSVIGHQYAKWFDDAVQVFEYGIENHQRLKSETKAFFNAFYSSSLDLWLLEAISAQLTTLIKSSWWDWQGRFAIWEGLGCCGLQTTDVTHYGSFPVVLFFPELQKSQMRLTQANIKVPGKIPHMMPGTFSCSDHDERDRIDLVPEFVLQVWRDVLWTGDQAYATEMWPTIRDALAVYETYDTDGDGLPNNTGPDQTYDQFPLRGTSAFVGFLYAAALKASAVLAAVAGEQERGAILEKKLDNALAELDEQLWNGSYYRLCYDPVDGVENEGVMADQINADWFVRQTTGQAFLPEAKVRSALSQILEHCSTEFGFIANCTWPFGNEIEIGRHTVDQARTPWSGVEYALAAHLILTGMEQEGLKLVRDVWDRYERAGLRFNHFECGEHYYRAMSAWAVYLASCGFALNSLEQSLTLAVRDEEAAFVVNTPTCWGFARTSNRGVLLDLSIQRGCLTVQELVLRNVVLDNVSVEIDGEPTQSRTCKHKGRTCIRFDRPLNLPASACARVLA